MKIGTLEYEKMSEPKTPQNASITKRVPNAPRRYRRVEREDIEKEDGDDINIPKVKRRLAFELVEEDPILKHIQLQQHHK